MRLQAQEYARQRGAHQVGQARRQQRLEPETGDVLATAGGQGAEPSEQDGDGTEVGEAAECEGDDGLCGCGQFFPVAQEIQVGDELVGDQFLADEAADQAPHPPRVCR